MTKGGENSVDRGREERIAKMKERLQQIAGGRMRSWESNAMPAEERERFWRSVLEFEERDAGRR